MFKNIFLLTLIFVANATVANRPQTIGDALKYGLDLTPEQQGQLIQRYRQLRQHVLPEQAAVLLARLAITRPVIQRRFFQFRQMFETLELVGFACVQIHAVLDAMAIQLERTLQNHPGRDLQELYLATQVYGLMLARLLENPIPEMIGNRESELPLLPDPAEPELPFLLIQRVPVFLNAAHLYALEAHDAYLADRRTGVSMATRTARAMAMGHLTYLLFQARLNPQAQIQPFEMFFGLYDMILQPHVTANLEIANEEYAEIERVTLEAILYAVRQGIDFGNTQLRVAAFEYYHAFRRQGRAQAEQAFMNRLRVPTAAPRSSQALSTAPS